MAKKRKPGGRPRKRPPPKPEGPLEIPDPRTVEAMLWQFQGGKGQRGQKESPADQAQDLVLEALEEPDERRRVELARQALGLWPDCADAYVLLAEHARGRKE